MFQFINDYSDGCHPKILKALMDTNTSIQQGYGDDAYSQKAKLMLRREMQSEQACIHFVSGGTQANLTVISHLLKPYEAVISANSGHINIHETGAIEATGHKVCAIPSENGKLTTEQISTILRSHDEPPHMVKPKLVYLSNATELGTAYSAKELKEIYEFCQDNDLLLFVDGARLGTAIMSAKNELTLADMAKYTDVFYIGGTKNGALLGEAIVINNAKLQEDFAFSVKQKGALLAKGRVLGIQFLSLFKDGLYYELAKHANEMATQLAEIIKNEGFQLASAPETNQIFPIFPNELAKKIQEKYQCYTWEKNNNTTILRMVCSWATPKEALADFKQTILNFKTR